MDNNKIYTRRVPRWKLIMVGVLVLVLLVSQFAIPFFQMIGADVHIRSFATIRPTVRGQGKNTGKL